MQMSQTLVKRHSWAHPQRLWFGRSGIEPINCISDEFLVMLLGVYRPHLENGFSCLDVLKWNGEEPSETTGRTQHLLSSSCVCNRRLMLQFLKIRYIEKYDPLWDFCNFLSHLSSFQDFCGSRGKQQVEQFPLRSGCCPSWPGALNASSGCAALQRVGFFCFVLFSSFHIRSVNFLNL